MRAETDIGDREAEPDGVRSDRRSMRVTKRVYCTVAVGRAVLTITNHAVNAPAWPASHVLCEQSAARPNEMIDVRIADRFPARRR